MSTQAARASVALAVITFVVLSAAVVGTGVFVLPVYLDMYAGAGWLLPGPTRFALGTGHPGVVVAVLVIVGAAVAFRTRGPDAATTRLAVGVAANLLLTLLLVAQVWVLLDFAIRAPAVGEAAMRRGAPSAVPPPADSAAVRAN